MLQNEAEAGPINEWRNETSDQPSEVIAFLKQGESLLVSINEQENGI